MKMYADNNHMYLEGNCHLHAFLLLEFSGVLELVKSIYYFAIFVS